MNNKIIIRVCQSLILSYLVTAVGILFYAAAIWKMNLSGQIVKACVIVLYILSAGVGGLYIGKRQKEKKFIWGMLSGFLYFLILFVITVLSDGFSGHLGMHFFTTLFICCMSGTLGGMLA